MSKKLLAIIIAVVLAAGGAVAFLAMREDTPDEASTSSETSRTEQTEGEDPVFNAKPTTSQAFEATMVTTAGGETINAKIRYDGQGKTHFQSSTNGKTIDMYMTKDGTISCPSDDMCIKIPGNNAMNQDSYEYDASDIENFRNGATYEGKQDCPAGTCDVWTVDDNDSQYATRVFVDNGGLLSKLISEGPEGKTEVTYEYHDVTVEVPTNVQELPTAR